MCKRDIHTEGEIQRQLETQAWNSGEVSRGEEDLGMSTKWSQKSPEWGALDGER